jgi:cyclopropane-fatty-acyl-phospholipid synthase
MAVRESAQYVTTPAAGPPAQPITGAAALLAPLLAVFFPDGLPVRFTFWDGTELQADVVDLIYPTEGDVRENAVHIASAQALRRLLYAPGELGLGRAYIAGDLDFSGDIFGVLGPLEHHVAGHRIGLSSLWTLVGTTVRAGALGPPPAPPAEEARQRGRRHSRRRDAQAIGHHYDVGNDFYRLVLGPSMTYSCARFEAPEVTLEEAQRSKLDLVCRKLGLDQRPGMRLLDVGCGWGELARHAAEHYDAHVVGVTISREQLEWGRRATTEAGLDDRVELRLQDYREVRGEFDAISSIGMFEHVGSARMAEYFTDLRSLLVPTGRLLNHAISSIGGSRLGPRSFIGRYVFPDGELIDVGEVVLAMEAAGFEVRDVESLREHYATTLRHWVRNLEDSWDEAVSLVGIGRARVWRLYMAASALGFADGGTSIHQVIGVVDDPAGRSGMPPTRRTYV